jgi:hypothetical protein
VPVDDDEIGLLLDDLGVELDLNTVAGELEQLAHALGSGSKAKIERAAAAAAESCWGEGTRSDISAGLNELRTEALEQVETIDAALAELAKPARENRVALALAYRGAAELMTRANENYERLAELESRLSKAPPEEHAALTLPVAVAADLAVAIPPYDADEAAAKFLESFPESWEEKPAAANQAAHWLARTLDDGDRRQKMRVALGALAEEAAGDFPRAARTLTALLAEPVPEEPAEDDLWVNLCIGVVQAQVSALAFELDDEL